jgi:glucose-1-phosphate cytidylyltransferase
MVTYGDGVTDLNINDVLKFHKKQNTIGTITGVHPRSKFGLVKIDKNNLVKGFEEKPVLPDWVNGGYMVFDKRFFNYLEVGQTEHPALKKLAKENKLSIYKHDGFWYAVDTFKELDDLNKIWEENQLWKVWR